MTLILDGAIHDHDEGGTLNAREVQWMTAGSGVIQRRREDQGKSPVAPVVADTTPKWTVDRARFSSDSFRFDFPCGTPGAEIRVSSGSSRWVQSGTRNRVSITMVEINMEPGAFVAQEVTASYNGFAFVIDGLVQIGKTVPNTGQVGWLDRPSGDGTSVLRVVAGESGARLILYAGDYLEERRLLPMVPLLEARSRALPDSSLSIIQENFLVLAN